MLFVKHFTGIGALSIQTLLKGIKKMDFKTNDAVNAIADKLTRYFATDFETATEDQVYKAVAMAVRDILLRKKNEYNARVTNGTGILRKKSVTTSVTKGGSL